MARPAAPEAKHRIKPHRTNGKTYAGTQTSYLDPATGKKKYRYVHWGKVDDDLKFWPNSAFFAVAPEERAKLVFPENWDMSEAEKFAAMQEREGAVCDCASEICDYACENRLFGDVWLLEQIALKTGIRQDLEKVFFEDEEIVDDIMTLAIFPLIWDRDFSGVARWQRDCKTPSSIELTPTVITRLTEAVTERHRRHLLQLRAGRLGQEELFAAESTGDSSPGDKSADWPWGQDKERRPLEQTTEVVVYAAASQMPAYYRSFRGAMADDRSLELILTDLEQAGFRNFVYLAERGGESLRNMDLLLSRNQSVMTRAETSQKETAKIIDSFGRFNVRPKEMKMDPPSRLYCCQRDIDYKVQCAGSAAKKTKKLKVNLYCDLWRRSREQLQLDMDITRQEEELNDLLTKKSVIDVAQVKRDNFYFNVVADKAAGRVVSFEQNVKEIETANKRLGFFSIVTSGVDFEPMEVLEIYRLRDEQELYFRQMKELTRSDGQSGWSEKGAAGRLFIMFVSLMLSSYLSHVWKSTELRDMFDSSLEILDEMRSIRCLEQANKEKFITPFSPEQVEICAHFGFRAPKGCAPTDGSRRKLVPKRGRPSKKGA
ncbi:MAG: hypothetical protein LBJ64_11280 [Deltaproteobacteria bacterium]|jgi:transposase|nr:hypothetical protein [Deltaproteobacteria bacterium]